MWALAACAPDAPTPEVIADNDRGVALMGRYEYAAAHAVFADVAARAPAWLDARVNWAIATLNRQEEGDERRALGILAEVLADDPQQLRALYTSGILHLYLGEAEAATALLRQVAAADPNDSYAAYFLGQALLQQGEYDEAGDWFLASARLDPYLRSAYWAGSQALRRAGRDEGAARLLADYQRFDAHPAARLAGFSYARMGPKAAARAATPIELPVVAVPEGPLFGAPVAIGDGGAAWIGSADVDGDGRQDVVLGGDAVAVVHSGGEDGRLAAAGTRPFALDAGDATTAVLWGDVDDDGLLDAVLCDAAGVRFWRQAPAGEWRLAETLGSESCAAGALFDADHDGDLDVLAAGPAGNELFGNNRNGSFRRLAGEMGLHGDSGRQVLVADLDGDRDQDILLVNQAPPHHIWQNDRTWQYRPFVGLDDLRETALLAVASADADADGHREIYAVAADGALLRWRTDGATWRREALANDAAPAGDAGAARCRGLQRRRPARAAARSIGRLRRDRPAHGRRALRAGRGRPDQRPRPWC